MSETENKNTGEEKQQPEQPAEEKTEQTKEEKQAGVWAEIWDFIRTLLIAMVIVFVVAHFIVRPIRVEGSSMYPTLTNGSTGLSNVIGRKTSGLKRFDVAIIYLEDKQEYLIKRVIGLPGETISYSDDKLYVNGEEVDEPFLNKEYVSETEAVLGTPFTGDVPEITLGEDEYFCLGDNRPNSRDSRYYGPFSGSQIIAKGAFVIWPFSSFGAVSW